MKSTSQCHSNVASVWQGLRMLLRPMRPIEPVEIHDGTWTEIPGMFASCSLRSEQNQSSLKFQDVPRANAEPNSGKQQPKPEMFMLSLLVKL